MTRLDPADVTGVILAGGQATRLDGFPKGRLRLGDVTLAERIRDALAAACGPLLVVTGDAEAYRDLGVPLIGDRLEGLGPIGGLEAALSHIRTPWALVAACDMPGLHAEVLTYLRDRDTRFQAVVPRVGGHLEPMCARWARGVLPTVRRRIATGDNKMAALLGDLVIEEITEEELRSVDPNLELRHNVNTPEDAWRLGVRR
jgi:molybdenum cofactor guanylyltransferase